MEEGVKKGLVVPLCGGEDLVDLVVENRLRGTLKKLAKDEEGDLVEETVEGVFCADEESRFSIATKDGGGFCIVSRKEDKVASFEIVSQEVINGISHAVVVLFIDSEEDRRITGEITFEGLAIDETVSIVSHSCWKGLCEHLGRKPTLMELAKMEGIERLGHDLAMAEEFGQFMIFVKGSDGLKSSEIQERILRDVNKNHDNLFVKFEDIPEDRYFVTDCAFMLPFTVLQF